MIEKYGEDNQITVNQHYVPMFYMKNFSIIKKKRKKEKVLIGFYQFKGSLLKELIPIESICFEKYFYGEDGKLEEDFSKKESNWASVIKDIINAKEYNLDDNQEKSIKQFAVFQYCRTLATYNYQKDAMFEMFEELVHNEVSNIDEEIVRNVVKDKIQSELCISDIISMCDGLVQAIDDLKISIIRFNTINKLIISDMPIILINPFCPNTVGLAIVGVVILFPVSPEVMVVIYDGKIYDKCCSYMVIDKEEDVINLNKYQVISAEERIMSKDENKLKIIVSDSSLILKRDEYNKNRKVNTGFDGNGMLIHTKARGIPYHFELSFCKLPKYIKRIPVECRVAFERRYDEEARRNLLFRVYRLPDIIKKNESTAQLNNKKFKDGYSKMQKFMDYYWGVKFQDQVITPKMMNILKDSSVKFFSCDN